MTKWLPRWLCLPDRDRVFEDSTRFFPVLCKMQIVSYGQYAMELHVQRSGSRCAGLPVAMFGSVTAQSARELRFFFSSFFFRDLSRA